MWKCTYLIIATLILMFLYSCKNASQLEIKPDTFLVDVRTPEEFNKGSVDNAVNIPLNELSNRLQEFNGKNNIVVFCRSGARSNKAMKMLHSQGILNVVNGGSWKKVQSVLSSEK